MKEEQLLAYLKANCAGRKNIRSRAQLQRALNLSKDQLTNLVHRMRCKGLPIAGGPRGYFRRVQAAVFRRRKLRIARSPASGRTHSLRRSSFPHGNRFAGFPWGPHERALIKIKRKRRTNMKRKIIPTLLALALTAALVPSVLAAQPPSTCYPMSVARSEDGTQIRKVCELGPEEDPAGIPRSDFEQEGFHYTLTDLLKQEAPEREERFRTERPMRWTTCRPSPATRPSMWTGSISNGGWRNSPDMFSTHDIPNNRISSNLGPDWKAVRPPSFFRRITS